MRMTSYSTMNPRRIFLLSVIGACSLALSSCAGLGGGPSAKAGEVEHAVFVWLKHPGSVEDRAKLVEAGRTLATIPGVISVSGGDSLPSKRPVVDSSFDVGFVIRFGSADAMNAYLSDPRHVKVTKEVLVPLSKKIVVHDFTVR
jgi:stress responsive alpha/beta barrel protein